MEKAPTMSSLSRMRERDLLLFVFNKEQQILRGVTLEHSEGLRCQVLFFISLLG